MRSIVGALQRSRLMPNPMPMPVMKNAGTPPSGAWSAPNAKNAAKLPLLVGRVAVAAEQVDAIPVEADLQHPEVIDTAERRGQLTLQQRTGQREPTDVAADREPVEVDLPRRRLEERPVHVVGETQLVDGRR